MPLILHPACASNLRRRYRGIQCNVLLDGLAGDPFGLGIEAIQKAEIHGEFVWARLPLGLAACAVAYCEFHQHEHPSNTLIALQRFGPQLAYIDCQLKPLPYKLKDSLRCWRA